MYQLDGRELGEAWEENFDQLNFENKPSDIVTWISVENVIA